MEDRKYSYCPNCDQQLEDKWTYCPKCGQENLNKIVSFKTLFVDFLGDFFNFDSSFFRSLVPFLFKPGEMTKMYVEGRRARYIPPVRILVFLCILLFATLSRISSQIDWDSANIFSDDPEIVLADSTGALTDTITLDPNITFNGTSFNVDLGIPDSILRQATADNSKFIKSEIDSIIAVGAAEAALENEEDEGRNWNKIADLFQRIPELSKTLKPERVVDSLLGPKSDKRADEKLILGTFISKRKVLLQAAKVYQSGGSGMVSFMIGNGTITIMLAVLLLSFLLKILYIRRKRHYVEHFIYSTHSHAALVFITLVYSLCFLFWKIELEWLYLLLIPYYIVSMRKFYGQGWFRTAFKFLIVGTIYTTFFLTTFFIGMMVFAFLFF